MKRFSVLWKSCGGRKSQVEVCFSPLKVIKFSFHNCRGDVIFVDACLNARNTRESCIRCS